MKGGNWSVLASALHNSTPPWSRDSLPTDELIAVYNNLLSSFSGSKEAFLVKLKDIYDALVESGTKVFIDRLGCFKWMDDFDTLFLNILESGGDEGGEMVTDDKMEKFKTFAHVLEAAQIVSLINITSLTQQQIIGIESYIHNQQQYDQAMSLLERTNAQEIYQQVYNSLKSGLDNDDNAGVQKRYRSLLKRLEKCSGTKLKGKVLHAVYDIKLYEEGQRRLDKKGVQKDVPGLGSTESGDY